MLDPPAWRPIVETSRTFYRAGLFTFNYCLTHSTEFFRHKTAIAPNYLRSGKNQTALPKSHKIGRGRNFAYPPVGQCPAQGALCRNHRRAAKRRQTRGQDQALGCRRRLYQRYARQAEGKRNCCQEDRNSN